VVSEKEAGIVEEYSMVSPQIMFAPETSSG
jgi:hypothetical protein